MNVFEEARKVRPQIDGTDENLAAARAILVSEIGKEPAPARRASRRRPWVIAGGVLVGAAAVTVGVLAIGSLAAPDPRAEAGPTLMPTARPSSSTEPTVEPSPEPTREPWTASTAFGAAGVAAAGFSGLSVAPGQYLRLEVATRAMVFADAANGWGENSADRSSATSAWEVAGAYEVYIPADDHEEWRYVGRAGQIGDVYGPDAVHWSQLYLQESAHSLYAPYGEVGGAGAPWPTEGGQSLAIFFDSMPRDPAQLIAWIDDHQETTQDDRNAKVGWLLVELLARNAGSTEARSAMYAALSMLDGFEVVDVVGDDITVSLTTPTVDVVGNATTERRTATIDTATGLVEETTTTTGSGSPLVPDAVPDMRSTYVTSVVDDAP